MIKLDAQVFNQVFPVQALMVYPNCVIVRRSTRLQGKKFLRGDREQVRDFSHQSYIRLLELVLCTSVSFRSLITLTFGREFPLDGKIAKAYLNSFLTYLRSRYGKQHYVWVMEYQKRGAVHFHILSSLFLPCEVLRVEAGLKWINLVRPSTAPRYNRRKVGLTSDYEEMVKFATHTKFWEAIREQDGAKRYMLKYCLKPEQKTVPREVFNCGRFWGASGKLPMITPKRVEVDNSGLDKLLDNVSHRVSSWDVKPRLITGSIPGLEFDLLDDIEYTHK